jgi:hypothetical protein
MRNWWIVFLAWFRLSPRAISEASKGKGQCASGGNRAALAEDGRDLEAAGLLAGGQMTQEEKWQRIAKDAYVAYHMAHTSHIPPLEIVIGADWEKLSENTKLSWIAAVKRAVAIWIGLSPDGLEARMAICPMGDKPPPMSGLSQGFRIVPRL